MEEATKQIKSEMGQDAVILHTRYFKEGGILGLFKKNYVEVTAAMDHKASETKSGIAETGKSAPNYGKRNGFDLGYELMEMKSMMNEMTSLLETKEHTYHFPKLGQNLYAQLIKHEVEDKIAQKIVKNALGELAVYPQVSQEYIKSVLAENLLKPLKKSQPISFEHKLNKPLVFPLVGPTGVGKTTTIAKLAANYSLLEHKKVSLVTVDTYRIAAVEQLKTIGDIMQVPVRVVYTPVELKDCLQELSDSDIIFVDTAGRSHKNSLQISELKNYLEIAQPDATYLVLSSTSKYTDMTDTIRAYQEMNISRIIFTKLDETSFYGSIYNIACKDKYSLSYFTNGQNIPDDIEIADPVKLVHLLMKEYHL